MEPPLESLQTTGPENVFGDFGEAPRAAERTLPESPIARLPATEPDDSFGDYGEAPSNGKPTLPKPSELADDPSKVGTEEVASAASFPDDDDFDDFGDFNEAVDATEATPVAESGQESDQFGDFADTSDSTPHVAHSVVEFKDPFVDRATIVFEQVFGQRGEVDAIDVAASEADVEEPIRLEDVLVSAAGLLFARSWSCCSILTSVQSEILSESSESQSVAPEWAMERLSSKCGILKVVERFTPSVIFDQSASNPYSHFSQPAHAPILNRSGERKEKRWSSFDLSERGTSPNPVGSGSVTGSLEETESVEGNALSNVAATVAPLPTGVKLDFTSFEAP